VTVPKNQRLAYVFALLTVGLWSTVASAFKLSLRYLQPAELLFYASVVSCFVLLAVILWQGKGGELRRLQREDWLASLGFGTLNPFLYYLVLFKAYELLPAQQAQPINHTWAITLTLLSIPLLRQKINSRQIVAIAVSYLGVLIISTHGRIWSLHFDSPAGVGLALFSTVIWSLYWVFSTRDRREPVIGLFLNFCCSLPLTGGYLAAGAWIAAGADRRSVRGRLYRRVRDGDRLCLLAQGDETVDRYRPDRQPHLHLPVPVPDLHSFSGRRTDPAGDLHRPALHRRRSGSAGQERRSGQGWGATLRQGKREGR